MALGRRGIRKEKKEVKEEKGRKYLNSGRLPRRNRIIKEILFGGVILVNIITAHHFGEEGGEVVVGFEGVHQEGEFLERRENKTRGKTK